MPHLLDGRKSSPLPAQERRGTSVESVSTPVDDDSIEPTTAFEAERDGTSSGESSRFRAKNGSADNVLTDFDIPLPSFVHTAARRPNKESGGFLLPTAAVPANILGRLERRQRRIREPKGKEKHSPQDPYDSERTSPQYAQRSTPSAGSSPLSKEVREDSPITGRVPHINKVAATRYGTDPAQIVNLALNLSANRRRYASAGRLSPMGPLPTSNSGRSLSHHLQQPRRSSRRVSTRAVTPSFYSHNAPQIAERDDDDTRLRTPGDDDSVISEAIPIVASDATLARVQKAKTTLELSYEYRRLLNYLPDISFSSKNRPLIARAKNKRDLEEVNGLGRAYNPLQYIRNRKVRWRENACLDTENSEWGDLKSVRAWVDRIIDQRRVGMSRIDDAYPLPSFGVATGVNGNPDTNVDNGFGDMQSKRQRKRRWRIDWEFSPSDLLADAQWLQEDNNIARIEDHKGDRPFTRLHTSIVSTPRTSKELSREQRRRSQSRGRFSISSLQPHLPSKAQIPPHHTSDTQHQDNGSSAALRNRASSQDRGRRWPRNILRSVSSSNSDESRRGKRRASSSRRRGIGIAEHAAFEKHMKDLLAQDAEENQLSRQVSIDSPEAGDPKPHEDAQTDGTTRKGPGSFSVNNMLQRLHERTKTDPNGFGEDGDGRRLSLDTNLDVSAPHSPKDGKIGHRPPQTHESPHRSFPFHLSSFRHQRNNSRRNISVDDFALSSGTPTESQSNLLHLSHSRSTTAESTSLNASVRPNRARDYAPPGHKTRGLRSEAKGSHDSRFRGFFRGGRIAEIVGNEASKVGGFLSRKDTSNLPSEMASPVLSEASDISDDEDVYKMKARDPTGGRVAQTSSGANRYSLPTSEPMLNGTPKPVIRSKDQSLSPFQRSPERHPDIDDPITRQQNEQRQRGRSARFDRLAPPRINLTGVSPSPSPTRNSSQRRDESRAPATSRGTSTSGSDGRIHEADRRLNEVLGIPGHVGRPGPPITGLARIASKETKSKRQRGLAGLYSLDGIKRIVQEGNELTRSITKLEVARIGVILQSSGVKAHELIRRAHEIPDQPLQIIQDLQKDSPEPLPRVPRSQEHLLAARILTNQIDTAHNDLRDVAEDFAGKRVPDFHAEITSLSEQITHKHSLASHQYADQADTICHQVSTTMTLAVKELNDEMDFILRRRRRKTRWLRRGGSLLLEWTLLAIMWWVWFIVVVWRLVKGSAWFVLAVVRWLFWLD